MTSLNIAYEVTFVEYFITVITELYRDIFERVFYWLKSSCISGMCCHTAGGAKRVLFSLRYDACELEIVASVTASNSCNNSTTTTTVLRPFFRNHPGEPVPEENFWTLRMCKGRLTEADTLTVRLGATTSGLSSAHLHSPPMFFYGPDALAAAQPTVSKH